MAHAALLAVILLLTAGYNKAILLPESRDHAEKRDPESSRSLLRDILLHPNVPMREVTPSSPLNDSWDPRRPHLRPNTGFSGQSENDPLYGGSGEYIRKISDWVGDSAVEDTQQPVSKPWKPWKLHGFRNLKAEECHGEPLILTPSIKAGNIQKAQELAKVRLPGTDVLSYSGYFTVNQTDNSNTFFWFFPAEVAVPEDAPVLVWLQGGPGATSLFGLFDEHGPFSVTNDLELKKRVYRWSLLANVIYIDNPVGTGFSFTQTDDGYARTETQVGQNLYEAMLQFYQLFPQYQQGELYISGESYAGKYVPALGHTIHVNNPNADLKLPLKGVAIGNGFVDPENMLNYGDLLFQVGLADINERDYIKNQTKLIQKAIQEKRWRDAFIIDDALMDGDLYKYPTYFYNISGSRYYYNYLQSAEPAGFGNYLRYVNQCYVRSAIHVGNQVLDGGNKVEKYLLEDVYRTAKDFLVPLLENYRVLIYNGQLDLICGLPLTENFLNVLEWSGAHDYRNAEKFVWKVEKDDVEPAGFVRHSGNFYQVAVRGGGHMIPYDQPRFSFDLFDQFLNHGNFRN